MSDEAIITYPLATTERLAKTNGGVQRISHGANVKLANLSALYTIDLAKKASAIAEHAGRTTIREDDIDLVLNI